MECVSLKSVLCRVSIYAVNSKRWNMIDLTMPEYFQYCKHSIDNVCDKLPFMKMMSLLPNNIKPFCSDYIQLANPHIFSCLLSFNIF